MSGLAAKAKDMLGMNSNDNVEHQQSRTTGSGQTLGSDQQSGGMTSGSTGMTGGSTGMTGGSSGMTGGSSGMTGGSTGMTGGSTGMTGGSTGLVGGSEQVIDSKTFTKTEDHEVLIEKKAYELQHRPVQKEFVVETKFVGEERVRGAPSELVGTEQRQVEERVVAAPAGDRAVVVENVDVPREALQQTTSSSTSGMQGMSGSSGMTGTTGTGMTGSNTNKF